MDHVALIELGEARFEPGYWQGMRQPAFLVPIRLMRPEIKVHAVQRFDALRAEILPSRHLLSEWPEGIAKHPVLERVLGFAIAVLDQLGMPVMGGVRAVRMDTSSPRSWLVGLPAISEPNTAPVVALRLACKLLSALARGDAVTANMVQPALQKLSKHYKPMAPAGVNTLRFLQAAHELDIPWRHMAKMCISLAGDPAHAGWTVRSRTKPPPSALPWPATHWPAPRC